MPLRASSTSLPHAVRIEQKWLSCLVVQLKRCKHRSCQCSLRQPSSLQLLSRYAASGPCSQVQHSIRPRNEQRPHYTRIVEGDRTRIEKSMLLRR
jgi:hypothetical protein